MSNSTQADWKKPAAMAIPKEGFFKVEQGRYGPTFPKTPANYGFTIIAKVKPGRAATSSTGRSRTRSPGSPMASPCSGCITCAGSSSISGPIRTSCIRGSSTPTSTSTPRMRWPSSPSTASIRSSRTWKGFPKTGSEHARLHQVRAGAPAPSFLEYAEYPYVSADEIKRRCSSRTRSRPCSTRCSSVVAETLELDDIQHILLTRTPALTGEYVFLSFRNPVRTRMAQWSARQGAIRGRVQSSLASKRWVTLAFTWNGLRALGLDEESLASFPEEFKQGMAARAEMLGDTGFNHPDQWVGGLASRTCTQIAILFAGSVERARSLPSTRTSSRGVMASRSCHRWKLEATPPYEYADHFGYRDRLSQPVMEGSGEQPTRLDRGLRSTG